jgi:hypothetical protein
MFVGDQEKPFLMKGFSVVVRQSFKDGFEINRVPQRS